MGQNKGHKNHWHQLCQTTVVVEKGVNVVKVKEADGEAEKEAGAKAEETTMTGTKEVDTEAVTVEVTEVVDTVETGTNLNNKGENNSKEKRPQKPNKYFHPNPNHKHRPHNPTNPPWLDQNGHDLKKNLQCFEEVALASSEFQYFLLFGVFQNETNCIKKNSKNYIKGDY